MEKVIKDGKVAVVIAPHFGGGWSTWNEDKLAETLLFHPMIVNAVLSGNRHDLDEGWFVENLGEEYRYVWTGSRGDLEVEWVKEGTVFKIDEYDGSESIYIISDETTFKA